MSQLTAAWEDYQDKHSELDGLQQVRGGGSRSHDLCRYSLGGLGTLVGGMTVTSSGCRAPGARLVRGSWAAAGWQTQMQITKHHHRTQELDSALAKRRAAAKRKLSALQAEGEALAADAAVRIKRARKSARAAPKIAKALTAAAGFA